MPHYELAIIGSGSGNSLITPYWDGKRVALIDGGVFGGTCLNVGCIPTKMFVYAAGLAAAPAEAGRLGVDLNLDKVHWNGIRDRIFGRIDAISASGRRYRADELDNVDLYEEHADPGVNERIEIETVPLSDLDEVIRHCRDSKTLVGLLWLRAFGEGG